MGLKPPTSVDGSEIRREKPVEVGSLSHYLQGFIHARWLAGFLPTVLFRGFDAILAMTKYLGFFMVIYGINTTLYANVLGGCPLPVTVSDHQYDFTFLGSEIPTKTFFYLPVGKQMNLTKLSGGLPMFSQ